MFITAVADSKDLQCRKPLEAWYNGIRERVFQIQGQLLHLVALWQESSQGVCCPTSLLEGRRGDTILGGFCTHGELCDEAIIRLRDIADIGLEGVAAPELDHLNAVTSELRKRLKPNIDAYLPHRWNTECISIPANQCERPNIL